jgi:hypothetical protein
VQQVKANEFPKMMVMGLEQKKMAMALATKHFPATEQGHLKVMVQSSINTKINLMKHSVNY